MEKILSVALEAEQKAQNKIAEAMAEKARLDKSAAEADSIIERYADEAEKRVKEFEKNENARAESEHRALEKRCADGIKRLDEQYRKNSEAWIDALFERVLK